MKAIKTVSSKLLTGILIAALFLTVSCKKDNQQRISKSLMGEWNETGLIANVGRNLGFYADSIALTVTSSGVRFTLDRFSGTYKIKGDSLLVNFNKHYMEGSGIQPSTVPFTGKLYEKATFKVNGNTLRLKYITYPADGPVLTEATFNRVLPD